MRKQDYYEPYFDDVPHRRKNTKKRKKKKSGSRASTPPRSKVSSSWGNSQHRQSAQTVRPLAQSVRLSAVSGRESARPSTERKTSAASICQTTTVGATRCQLELFSIKRASTHQ